MLAAGDADGKVSVIDSETGKIIAGFEADKEIVNEVGWSPTEDLLQPAEVKEF